MSRQSPLSDESRSKKGKFDDSSDDDYHSSDEDPPPVLEDAWCPEMLETMKLPSPDNTGHGSSPVQRSRSPDYCPPDALPIPMTTSEGVSSSLEVLCPSTGHLSVPAEPSLYTLQAAPHSIPEMEYHQLSLGDEAVPLPEDVTACQGAVTAITEQIFGLLLPEPMPNIQLPAGETDDDDDGGDDSDPESEHEENSQTQGILLEESDENDYFEDADACCEDGQHHSSEDLLYPSAQCTLGECMVAILTFMVAHRLSKTCLGDLLALLKLLLPAKNLLVDSVKLFFKHFGTFQTTTTRHYYCQSCTEILESVDSVCTRCGCSKKPHFTIQMSVQEQLQKLFQRPGFFEQLSYPTQRVKKNHNAYEDIYDGAIYKEAKRDHFGTDNWITFTWNTDGFALFRSSTFEIWPFYLAINELPPHLRYKKENMILAGMWFGKGKFDPNYFLKPIYEEFEVLRNGVWLQIPVQQPIFVKCGILCGTCDSPGKAMFLRHNNFNGLHGCLKCLSRGRKSVESKKVFVYKYEEDLALRSDALHRQHLQTVRETNKKCYGVKGPSYLQCMVLVSMIRSTSVDVMHAVFLGVMKRLMILWFDEKFKKERFSLYRNAVVVSEYLCSAKPPHFLQRIPQAISKLKYWKASEFQSFLFYYSVPILHKVMDQEYFNHFKRFYLAICLLCQESISEADIVLAQSLLDEFVKMHEEKFGLRHMSFNLHLLRHLPDVVKELGPLWTSSCFMFEDLNGALKYMTHGTQHTALQVQSNFELVTRLPTIFNELPDGELKKLCNTLYSSSSRLNLTYCISPHTYVVGRIRKDFVDFEDSVTTFVNSMEGNVSVFQRLKKNSMLYVVSKSNPELRNSSYVMFQHEDNECYGILKIFTKVSMCECVEVCECESEFCAVVNKLECTNEVIALPPPAINDHSFMLSYNTTNILMSIPVSAIMTVCSQIQVEDKMYIARLVNQFNFHQ